MLGTCCSALFGVGALPLAWRLFPLVLLWRSRSVLLSAISAFSDFLCLRSRACSACFHLGVLQTSACSVLGVPLFWVGACFAPAGHLCLFPVSRYIPGGLGCVHFCTLGVFYHRHFCSTCSLVYISTIHFGDCATISRWSLHSLFIHRAEAVTFYHFIPAFTYFLILEWRCSWEFCIRGYLHDGPLPLGLHFPTLWSTTLCSVHSVRLFWSLHSYLEEAFHSHTILEYPVHLSLHFVVLPTICSYLEVFCILDAFPGIPLEFCSAFCSPFSWRRCISCLLFISTWRLLICSFSTVLPQISTVPVHFWVLLSTAFYHVSVCFCTVPGGYHLHFLLHYHSVSFLEVGGGVESTAFLISVLVFYDFLEVSLMGLFHSDAPLF